MSLTDGVAMALQWRFKRLLTNPRIVPGPRVPQRLRESELRYRALQMQLSVASVGQQSAVDRLALQRARLEEILGSYERAAEARRQAEDAERRARGLLTDALQEVVRFSVPEAEAGEEKDEDGGRDDEVGDAGAAVLRVLRVPGCWLQLPGLVTLELATLCW